MFTVLHKKLPTNGLFYFVWGIGPTGSHKEGRALDFMTYDKGEGVKKPGPLRTTIGNEIAKYVYTHHKRLNVEYIIWRQRIWNATRKDDISRGADWNKWRKMGDRDNPTKNHMDHIHVTFHKTGTYSPLPPPTPKPTPKPKPTKTQVITKLNEVITLIKQM